MDQKLAFKLAFNVSTIKRVINFQVLKHIFFHRNSKSKIILQQIGQHENVQYHDSTTALTGIIDNFIIWEAYKELITINNCIEKEPLSKQCLPTSN